MKKMKTRAHFLLCEQFRLIKAFMPKGNQVKVFTFTGAYFGMPSSTSTEVYSLVEARRLYKSLLSRGYEAVDESVALVELSSRYGTHGYGLAASMKDAEAWKAKMYERFPVGGYDTKCHASMIGLGLAFVTWSRRNTCD